MIIVHLCGCSLRPSGASLLRLVGTRQSLFLRFLHPRRRDPRLDRLREKKVNWGFYFAGLAVLSFGLTYAAVPLYRKFCQATGFGGTTQQAKFDQVQFMKPKKSKIFKVKFNSYVSPELPWTFTPVQPEVYVHAGETALVFFTAKNLSDQPIVGVSTYNVVPFDAGPYFAKIQCFCFEEQMLGPNEEVDMPVFFYLDPEIVDEPLLHQRDELLLNYTFFSSSVGPVELPSYFKPHDRTIGLPPIAPKGEPVPKPVATGPGSSTVAVKQ